MDSIGTTIDSARGATDRPRTAINGSEIATDASLQWYEAVAVVLQLAETIKRTGMEFVPDLAHVELSREATIAILSGADRLDPPVKQLATMLQSLLPPAGSPPRLVELLGGAFEGPPSAQTLDDFVKLLHFFERPGRDSVLRGVFERIANSAADARLTEELQRLTAKVREAAAAHPVVPVIGRRRRNTGIAALIALILIVAAAVVVGPGLGPASAGSGVSAVLRAGEQVQHVLDDTVARVFGGVTADGQSATTDGVPSLAASDTAAPQPPPMRRARPAIRKATDSVGLNAGDGRLAAPVDLPGAIVPSLLQEALEPVQFAMPQLASRTTEPDTERARIYSRFDAGVTPPVPLPPVIGHVTTDSVTIPGDMDIVVDRSGAVARVTLLAPNDYQDRWLMFAMKNRQFRPAMAHGHPVAYRLRVRTAS